MWIKGLLEEKNIKTKESSINFLENKEDYQSIFLYLTLETNENIIFESDGYIRNNQVMPLISLSSMICDGANI